MKLSHCLSLAAALILVGCNRTKNFSGDGENTQPGNAAFKTGTVFALRIERAEDPATGEKRPITQQSLDHVVTVLRSRLVTIGVAEPIITPTASDRITVKIPRLAPDELHNIRKQLQQVAKLDFRVVHPESSSLLPAIEAKQKILDPAWTILPMNKDKNSGLSESNLMVHRVPDITGEHIKSAFAGYDLEGWFLNIEFDKEAGEKFFELTRAMRVSVDRFAIVLDGQILSAPTTQVSGGIAGGSFRLTGKFTEQEARGLANALMNPLQNAVKIEEEHTK